ncbi:phospholipase A1-IIgamma-like [Mercurialis annua]|uniref:phospholipase A1-IIgamma-like n=1 Tax=Mercurialis annua TaxID=3986 RepID=UPI00215EFF82|nr:phospholipase A1-IIgamma-like [Mercurialis annua]
MSAGNIAKRWKELSGQQKWKGLLDPLDIDLRRYLIHYGEMAQATYDTFNSERKSKFAGDSRYSMKHLFSKVGLISNNPFQYQPVKYLYATSKIGVPESFILKPLSKEAWNGESNWIGYIAVATDSGKAVLGRRDIVLAWRGTVQPIEWVKDFDFPLKSASEILGEDRNAHVHEGFLSIYTSDNPHSQYNKTSVREQMHDGLKQVLDQYKNEDVSLTITGHSLGAALTTLSAADIVANGLNRSKTRATKVCPVTAFAFACPRTGDWGFRQTCNSLDNLSILRVQNTPDIVPNVPPLTAGYVDVGELLEFDTIRSMYLKPTGEFIRWHNLETYLHGVAGTQGINPFHLDVKRDIALVNKELDFVKTEYLVPARWWLEKNKGMVQQKDGTWILDDHEDDP